MSEHLLQGLAHLARPYMHDPVLMFEQTEVLMAMHVLQMEDGESIPAGRFVWNRRGRSAETLMEEATLQGAAWPPLKAGMLGGKSSVLTDLIRNFTEELKDIRKGMRRFYPDVAWLPLKTSGEFLASLSWLFDIRTRTFEPSAGKIDGNRGRD